MLSGQVQLGFVLMYPAPAILEVVHRDWDWFWVDGQHGQHDYRSILECVRAADVVRRPVIVRVPGHDYGFIGPMLDMNVAGIIVPMVNNAEQARRVVIAAKFPPLGQRSFGGRRVIDIEGSNYDVNANEESLLIVQIETSEALRNVEAILATPGVDGVLVGTDDFLKSLGLPRNTPITEPVLDDCLQKTAQAARTSGKIGGAVIGTAEQAVYLAELGYTLLAGCLDVELIRNGSSTVAEPLRRALQSDRDSKDKL